MKRFRLFAFFGSLAVAAILLSNTALAQDAKDQKSFDQQQYERTVSKAIAFLKTKGQSEDGSYSSQAGIGPTALVTTSLLRHGVPTSDLQVARSLEYLKKFQQPDGGIYQTGTFHRNYETCLAVLCFSQANKDGKYDEMLQRADAFLKGIQWDEGEGKDPTDVSYGGGGYGSHKRPDLSNTSFLVDALKAAGNDADSEAIQRALIFVSRCQNLESEHNRTPFAAKNPDGGFYYTCAAGGESKAGETANGGLRSYGSMTYAGLKSMLYAGVGPDDPRVKAAVKWAGMHYDLKSNPGMGSSGLYYYYLVFAKALDASGKDVLTDDSGTPHNWRADLLEELSSRQRSDGAWVNNDDRWLEGDANLVTGYALMALSYLGN